MLFTSPVSGFNIVADWVLYTVSYIPVWLRKLVGIFVHSTGSVKKGYQMKYGTSISMQMREKCAMWIYSLF